MNFGGMQAEVMRTLRESKGVPSPFIVSDDIKQAINEGVHEMADDAEWYIKHDTLPLGNVTYYDLSDFFPDFLSLRRVFNPQTNRWLTGVNVRDLDERTYARWETVIGPPQHVFIRGLWILGTFPKNAAATETGGMRIDEFSKPSEIDGHFGAVKRMRFATVGFGIAPQGDTLDVWYAADFPDLVEANDAFPGGLPTEFHRVPVEYACYELLLQDRQLAKAMRHYAEYVDLQAQLKAWVWQQAVAGGVGVFGDPVYGVLPGPPVGGRG